MPCRKGSPVVAAACVCALSSALVGALAPLPTSVRTTPRSVGFDPLGLSTPPADFSIPVVAHDDGQPHHARDRPLKGSVACIILASFSPALPAAAKGGEYGLFEGRISSMLHPTLMATCFFTSLVAGYTGYSWRRLREATVELAAAKKEVKAAEASAAVDAADDGETPQAAPVDAEAAARVETLTAEVASLREGNFRDVHYTLGTVLLAIGIPFAIEGPVNTYMRAGKLFPGPHLYAGATCVALWAIAAACVPHMQKGKEWARITHIALNAVNVALFAYYQVPTGLEITNKVIQNTKFP